MRCAGKSVVMKSRLLLFRPGRKLLGVVGFGLLSLGAGGCASDAEASRNPSVNPSHPLSGAETAGRGPLVGANRTFVGSAGSLAGGAR